MRRVHQAHRKRPGKKLAGGVWPESCRSNPARSPSGAIFGLCARRRRNPAASAPATARSGRGPSPGLDLATAGSSTPPTSMRAAPFDTMTWAFNSTRMPIDWKCAVHARAPD